MRNRITALMLLALATTPAKAQINEGFLSAPPQSKCASSAQGCTKPAKRAKPARPVKAPKPEKLETAAQPEQPVTPQTPVNPASPGKAAAPAVGSYVYALGPGDRLKVVVYGEDKLTGDFVVNGEGVVSFPLLGDVPASGKSIAEFRAALIGRLTSEYLRNPSVTAEVINFRPVYILGEVAKPGEFAYTENMSIYALVAKAGGFTYRANQKAVFVRHEGEPDESRYPLRAGTLVRPGDTIRIGQSIF